MNVICTFTIRCFLICLSPSLLSSSLDELRKLFLQNGYPSGYNINDVLNRQENRPEQPTTTVYKKKGPLNSILFRVTEQNPHQTTEGLHQ